MKINLQKKKQNVLKIQMSLMMEMEILLMENQKEMENLFGKMVIIIQVNLKMEKNMEKE